MPYYYKCLISQEICRGGSVTCPFCRNTFVQSDVNKLPNNSYALHMIKFLKEKKTVHGTVSSNSKFTLDQSIFILRLFQSGTLKGEIHIRPAPTFHPLFVQKLGDFCYKSPKTSISNNIDDIKVCP